ncbi:MAG: hypothetical protein ISQ22_08065 [Rhizobiales bacterium]|jgi:hypothetical protein|nr:hypothetical protein [Hyphomicrobiales bacterium]
MKISHFPNNLPNNASEVYPQLVDAIQQTDTLVENDMDADAALIWSVLWYGKMSANKQVWDHYRAQNKPVIVIEVGGLIRNTTWKLGINGINRDADFAVDTYMPNDRLQKFGIVLQPWKQQGEYVLICGQHGHSEQWRYMPEMDTYYRNTIREIRQVTDKPIVVRSHPRYRESLHWACDMQWYKEQDVTWNIPKHVQQTYDSFDLEHMLKHTHFTVSHSSNAGITSIIHGVPAVVSESSLAYEVGSKMDSWLSKPDRHNWLNRMTYTEWFADEIHLQWSRIRDHI